VAVKSCEAHGLNLTDSIGIAAPGRFAARAFVRRGMAMSARSALGIVAVVATLVVCRRAPAGTWTELGPELGGRLDGIVADPNNPNVLVVASPGGGVWRTQQGSGGWQPAQNVGLADYSVFHLEWDRVRPGRLLASTWSDLYASTDLGDHWTDLTGFGGIPAPLMPPDHGTDPKPFAQLKLSDTESVILWSKPCQGLYYSYDGVTFTQHWPFSGGSSNPDNCIQAVAADDLTGHVYFSTMGFDFFEAAHVYANTCAWTTTTPCLSWAAANTGLPAGITVPALAWTGVANRLAAAMNSYRGAVSTTVFVTTDGSLWSATSSLPAVSNDARPLLWPALNQLFLGTVEPYQTTDLGSSWSAMHLANAHPDTRAIFAQTYEGGKRGYVWTATDGVISGSYANITRWSWTPGNTPSGGTAVSIQGLRVWQPYYVAVASQSSRQVPRLFIGSQDNDALCSDDDGATWTTNGSPPSLGCGDFPSLVFAPSNPDRAYSRSCGAGVARTDNAVSAASCDKVVWTALTPSGGPSLPHLWTRAMTAVHPTDPDRVYFARLRDVAISNDGGASLTISAPFPGDGAEPVSLYVDAGGNIYAGTIEQGAFVSTDNGGSWLPWGLNSPAPRVVMRIAYSPVAGGTFFMATSSGLYRLRPGGTWTRMTDPSPGYTASDIEVDPDCPHRIYMALGFVALLGVHRGGILMSTDNGTTWTSITSGLTIHQAPIADVQLNRFNPRYLYAAVYGQGAWRYDPGNALDCPPLVDTATPTATVPPTASVTPTATLTVAVMATPTVTRIPTNTVTTGTPTRTIAAAPSPSPSATPSRTATSTSTSMPTATPTRTPTPTRTTTPTQTTTFSPTLAATVTPTATITPTPSDTPVSTAMQTPTVTPLLPPCIGDCNANGQVTIDELLTLVNVALGTALPAACPNGVPSGAEVNVAQIIQAVNNALYGCPGG
jgi:hypothetical protein